MKAGTALLLLWLSACGADDDAPVRDAGADGGPVPNVDAGPRADAGPVDGGPASDWRREADLPEPIQEICGAVHEGRLWIAGGIEGDLGVSAAVRIFDPATGTWSDGPALPEPRHHAMLVSTGPDLWLLGGMRTLRFEPLDTVFVLRAGASSWEMGPSLPELRAAAAAGFVAGRIVIAGGNSEAGRLATTTLVLDVAAETWSTAAGMPVAREHTAGFVTETELWVVAGRMNSLDSNTADVAAYDPATDTWRSAPPLLHARGGHGVALLDGVAHAMGGEEPGAALTSVERLDVATGTAWEMAPPTVFPHHGHVALAAAGRIWVIGGGDAPSLAAIDVVESYSP